jgi:acyl-CoA synthetase (AMP-forming)/AMP-acid ligase II
MDFITNLNSFSAQPCVTTQNTSYTYAEIIDFSESLASLYVNKSLVFLLCGNNEETLIGYLACLKSKSIPLLINENLDEKLLAKLILHYKPNYIWGRQLTTKSFSITYTWRNYNLQKLSTGIDHNFHNDLALLLMTSGTTGSSKLVRLSIENIESNTNSIIKALNICKLDKPITTLPFNYTYGLSIINSHLASGCELILTDSSIVNKEFWNLLTQKKATTFGGVPYTYQMLDRFGFEKMDLPSITKITQAGGKLTKELSLKFSQICSSKGIEFIVMYGQTEATARMSYLPNSHSISKAGSIGQAVPDGQFYLINKEGKKIDTPNVEGELIYAGPNVCLGYAENAFDLSNGDENNGILHTGDIAIVDEEGFYYIKGRIKRFIKVFGNRVSLDEIESLAAENGFKCVCTGKEDKLIIVSEDNDSLAALNQTISKLTKIHPTSILVKYIDLIPRNEAGKVLYNELNQLINL